MVNSRFMAEINKLQVSVTLRLFTCCLDLLPLRYVLGFLFLVCYLSILGEDQSVRDRSYFLNGSQFLLNILITLHTVLAISLFYVLCSLLLLYLLCCIVLNFFINLFL